MAKTTKAKQTKKKDLPGLPLEVFKAGIQAVEELRNTGKYQLFLGRQSSLQIIGADQDFFEALRTQDLCREFDEEQAGEVLQELRRYARAYGQFPDNDGLVSFLTRVVYSDEYEALDAKGQETFRNTLKAKLQLVKDALYTDSIRERRQRLKTATVPCLEHVEFELVTERRSPSVHPRTEGPFLRVRLRHSIDSPDRFGFFGPFSLSWGGLDLTGLPSFEVECDESDIDLLLLRLSEAKDFLLSARESEKEA